MEVVIATPTFDKSVSVDYVVSLIGSVAECAKHGIEVQLRIIAGNQFIDLARNACVHYFLHETKATDLLFIDADQGWDPLVIPRVLGYEQAIVGGLPPKKCDPPTFHANALTGVIEDGLFESYECGTGFLRIKRSVFEKIDRAYPELKSIDPTIKEIPYFQTGFRNGEIIPDTGFLGEDMFFCRLWMHIGGSIWIDSDITFTHRGSKAWRGNFYEHCVETGLLIKEITCPVRTSGEVTGKTSIPMELPSLQQA